MANGNMTIERSKNMLASLSMTKETTGTSSSLVVCLAITHLCMPQPIALRLRSRMDKLAMDFKPSENGTVDPMPLSDDANPDVLDTPTTIHRTLRPTVITNIHHSAQEHQKLAFDRRHNSNKEFTAGTVVYIKNQRRSKMEPCWTGPYLVVKSLTKGQVKLKDNMTGKRLSNTYHASNLTTYQDEEASPPPQSPDDCPSDSTNDSPKQKTLKRPCEEPDNDDIYISQKHKQTKVSLPRSGRRYLR